MKKENSCASHKEMDFSVEHRPMDMRVKISLPSECRISLLNLPPSLNCVQQPEKINNLLQLSFDLQRD